MKSRNKGLIITGIIALVIALGLLIVCSFLNGFDYVKFFQSSYFVWICVILGMYVLGVIVVLVCDKINRL